MPQELATTVPPKGFGSLQWRDLLKGLYYACAGQLVSLISFVGASVFQEQPRFPNTWVEWLPYVKGLVYTIGGYLLAKLGVNNVGQIFAKDKPIVHVDAEQLDALKQQADNNKTS